MVVPSLFPLADLWQLSEAASRVRPQQLHKNASSLTIVYLRETDSSLASTAAAGPVRREAVLGHCLTPGALPLPSVLWAAATPCYSDSQQSKILVTSPFNLKKVHFEKDASTRDPYKADECFPLSWLYFERIKHFYWRLSQHLWKIRETW